MKYNDFTLTIYNVHGKYEICVFPTHSDSNRHSGYAYSLRSDWTCVLTSGWKGQEMASLKVPTALLLNPDTSFNSFGYNAEKTYADIAADGDDEGRSYKEYYFFHRFKKMLKEVCKY